jgi:hypothetical protein
VPHSTIEDPDGRPRNQTLVGQKAWCAACQSVGIIIPAPGSPDTLRERFQLAHYQGQEALGGDLVVCKCKQHPQVISRYGRSVMIVATGNEVDAIDSRVLQQFDEQLRAAGSGASEGYPYHIETTDGRSYSGRVGGDGCLPRICTGPREDYHVYWGDEALAKQNGA